MKKKLPQLLKSIVPLVGIGASMTACDTMDIITSDFLRVDARVLAQDGTTPFPGLPIDNYRWVVTYEDGSTVSMPFDQPLATDANGRFAFSSGELQLRSGNPVLRGCTDVCVETDGYYETVCTLEESYAVDVCDYWYYDQYGYEQCGAWHTEYVTDCVEYGERYVSYCTTWAEDCRYDYPERDVDDIAYTLSEIDYRRGSSLITTSSSGVSSGTYSDIDARESRRTLQWLEAPTFVLPFTPPAVAQKSSALTAELTARQQKVVTERNAGHKVRRRKVEVPAVSSRPAARHFRFEDLGLLNPSQSRALEKARKCFTDSQGQ
jgi:hypothetical protein